MHIFQIIPNNNLLFISGSGNNKWDDIHLAFAEQLLSIAN